MNRTDDIGKFLLRATLGVLILLHGIAKLAKGVDGIGHMLASHGVPSVLAYLVFVGTTLHSVFVNVGVYPAMSIGGSCASATSMAPGCIALP